MILSEIIENVCEGPTNNFRIFFQFFKNFLEIYLGFVWQKTNFFK